MAAQNLHEQFDVVNAEGQFLGYSKARGEVHRDGDWHQSIHLWVVFNTDPVTLLLQRRSYTKDTHPGRVDVSVAGHLAAGESPMDALRESDEEVGLRVLPEEVAFLGKRHIERISQNWKDREIQHIYVVRTDVKFENLCAHPEEVASLLCVTLANFRALIAQRSQCPALEKTRQFSREITLTWSEMVSSDDGYPEWVLDTIMRETRREA
jgi:isopentenyldiphosphate isomerase